MKKIVTILLLILLAGTYFPAHSQHIGLEGQAIGWTTLNPSGDFQMQGGLRYIPELKVEIPVGNLSIEGEGSLDIWGSSTYAGDSLSIDKKLAPYRAWVKLSGEQFELRAGLQKINFGSANMIRPLMWFDQLDPKDPLRLTKGVYGLLGRYYFLNNANIWLWGLYGNNERKGLEMFPSKKNSIEFGGRVQVPVGIGELAATYHHREANIEFALPVALQEVSPENRYALDAKVDLLVGAWFEAALIQKNSLVLSTDNTSMLNAGLDYTFNIGNGLHVMGEGLYYMLGEEPFQSDQEIIFGGISLSYPLNIVHNLSAIVFIDAMNKELYRFVNWSMTYDRWSFYTMAFWNPERYLIPGFEQEGNLFSGVGFQCMAVFNY